MIYLGNNAVGVNHVDPVSQAEIDELKRQMSNVSVQMGELGEDVIPYLANEPGYINDRGIISSPSSTSQEITFDYVAVSPGDVLSYSWRMKGSPWLGFAYYGSDKSTFVQRITISSGEQTGEYYSGAGRLVVPANAYYVRMTMRTYGDYSAALFTAESVIALANDKYLPNLFSVSKASLGYMAYNTTDGAYVRDQSNAFEMVSDYIDINESETLTAQIFATVTSSQQQYISVYEFDSNKAYLRRDEGRSDSGAQHYSFTRTVGTNTKYVRISARFWTDGKLMVVPGKTAKEWVPNDYDLATEQRLRDGGLRFDFAKGLYNPLLRVASPKIIMHRGASNLAPENTIPAFELAGQTGAFAIETDVYETTDGYFVLMHDNNVAGMTDGTGNLTEMTFAQTQELTIDAGANIEQYPGLKIPTLNDYLKICRRYGKSAFVEIKNISNYGNLINLIRAAGMEGSTVLLMYNINYFSISHIAYIRKETYMPICLISNVISDYTKDVSFANRFSDIWICANKSLITQSNLELAHMANVPVNAYTYVSKNEALGHVELGLDMITTNDYYNMLE